jgi:hypothetical protein
MRHNRLRLKTRIRPTKHRQLRLRSTISLEQDVEDVTTSQLHVDLDVALEPQVDVEVVGQDYQVQDNDNFSGSESSEISHTIPGYDEINELVDPAIILSDTDISDATLSPDIDDAFVLNLATSLYITLSPFLMSSAGGKLEAKMIKTTTNHLAAFMIWAYAARNGQDVALPATASMAIVEQSRIAIQLTIELIAEHPAILDEYIIYLQSVYLRSPSTILNNLDMIDKLHQFVLYGCQLSIQVPNQYEARYAFYSMRCKRVLRKDLKTHKLV